MTDRLTKIFNSIPKCTRFADVGCDHGYIAMAMLESKKCDSVIVSDISFKCLSKAEELLKEKIKSGKAISVVSDGLKCVPKCDCVLIAGMGGQEICQIINQAPFLPQTLVLQPMKNCDKVRLACVEKGYKFISDGIFYSAGKYYDLMVLVSGQDRLTEQEIKYGRDNINGKSEDFKKMMREKKEKILGYLERDLKDEQRRIFIEQLNEIEKYV